MKIIDRETGKRVGSPAADPKTLNKHLKEVDPIVKNAEKDEDEELSPMDPPDAYDEARNVDDIDATEKSSYVLELEKEHEELVGEIESFEKALLAFEKGQFYITKEINDQFNNFFVYFDEHIIPHNRKEERYLFPLLHKRLLESGEHGTGPEPITAVDVMEGDHVQFIQLATLTFNLLGLALQFNDKQSMAMTFDLAYHKGIELVEGLRLHIFKEDNTLLPLANKLLTKEEFDNINKELANQESHEAKSREANKHEEEHAHNH